MPLAQGLTDYSAIVVITAGVREARLTIEALVRETGGTTWVLVVFGGFVTWYVLNRIQAMRTRS